VSRARFYVQREPRAVWHVESDDDPEVMLCGEVISVELSNARVSHRVGLKPCLWCKKKLDEFDNSLVQSSGSSSPSGRLMSDPVLQTTLRVVTTRTGTTT